MNIFWKIYKQNEYSGIEIKILEKIKVLIYQKINLISKRKIGKNYVYTVYQKDKYTNEQAEIKNSEKILKRINQKTKRILRKENNARILFDKNIKEIIKREIDISKRNTAENRKKNFELKQIEELLQITQFYYENKTLYREYIEQILHKIIELQKEIPEEQAIYILIKNNTQENIKKIINMTEQYKTINIVTQNVKRFKDTENRLEENEEIITILNNKRKSLVRAKYIINVDFSPEEIVEYNVNRTAIIFNLNLEKIKNIHNFDGSIINNIKINVADKEKFEWQDIYISTNIKTKEMTQKALKAIKFNKIDIIGNNGKIALDKIEKKG